MFKNIKTILIDASEHPYLCSAADPQENYSGKKRHTRKNTLIASPDGYIHYLGKTVGGSRHDYLLLKNEFDVNSGLFNDYQTLVDLGYLGIDKDYFTNSVQVPHESPVSPKTIPLLVSINIKTEPMPSFE